MAPAVFGLLFASAILHAAWNILLKTSGDPLRTAGRGMVVAALVLIPSAVLAWLIERQPAIPTEAWFLAVASGALEAVYFVLLSAAYRRGDLSLVYPIARGTAPLLAVLIGVVVLGERLGPASSIGVGCLLAGILVLQRPWAVFARGSAMSRSAREAAWIALVVGAVIASYSAIDLNGVRLVPPWLYAAMFWTFMAIFLVAWIAAADRGIGPSAWRSARRALAGAAAATEGASGDAVAAGSSSNDAAAARSTVVDGVAAGSSSNDAADRPVGQEPELGWGRAAAGGLMTLAAYLLVLVAYVFAPLTAVAPVRESAIVIVSGWGTFRLGEAAGSRAAASRFGAAILIVVGAILLAVGD